MPRFAAPRAALLPAFRDIDATELSRGLDAGGASLETLILNQQLGPTWHARTSAPAFADSHRKAAMLYLQQVAAQREIDEVLSRAGIAYAIFKGAAIRELIYDQPAVRVCYDIDVLVTPGDRAAAARALVDAGFRLSVDPSLASHEVVLSRDAVSIDLHWSLLRPGRTPTAMAGQMLSRRQRHGDRWILGDADILFVLLVHPAFSKHLSTSQMGLHRLADLVLWLQQYDADWPALHRQLEDCGLKTAGWTMLNLVRMLSPSSFMSRIASPLALLEPNRIRAAYLMTWLNQDLSSRFKHFHMARLLGFSVLLHDKPADAWRALRGWQRSRATRAEDAAVFGGIS